LDGGLPVFRNLEAGLKPCLVEAGRVTASLGGLGKTEIRKALGRPDPFLDFVIASTRSSPEIDGLSHSGGGRCPTINWRYLANSDGETPSWIGRKRPMRSSMRVGSSRRSHRRRISRMFPLRAAGHFRNEMLPSRKKSANDAGSEIGEPDKRGKAELVHSEAGADRL
jgi:hypothetical protein